VIAPGNYDGVHLGHRALIRTARAFASEHGLETCVLTFDPHPASVLPAARAKAVLTQHARRAQLLHTAGADRVHVQSFTPEFAALSPEAFIDALLDQGARALVVGPDFRFGNARAGDVALLERVGQQRGFRVLTEPPVLLEGERVSSSAIREALRAGDVPHANRMLGRAHELMGRVVRGDQRGRTIGFPTANLDPEPVLPPLDGVYAVLARELDPARAAHSGVGPIYEGVANLGTRPTFEAGRSLEVHLFDFERDIYGAQLRVGFVGRVRGEARFSGIDELRAQIARDCDSARELLRKSPLDWRGSL
jgi:riboflavin kinase / FMN adenylyltransferase